MWEIRALEGDVCGPVRIQIEGFRPVFSEVVFLEMQLVNGDYDLWLATLSWSKARLPVDMLGHRLVHVKQLDLK